MLVYLNAYAPGPFPRKEGERGSVVKEKEYFHHRALRCPFPHGEGVRG